MLINLSNHPSIDWGEKQKSTAIQQFGEIIDFNFPQINPEISSKDVKQLAKTYFDKIMTITKQQENQELTFAVHIQGEFTFVFALVTMLKKSDVKCIASTTERKSVEKDDGTKISIFSFIQFREYL